MSATLNDPRIAAGMRRQFELRKQQLDAGAKQIGWKVGLGAPAALERCKLTKPVVGFLLDRAAAQARHNGLAEGLDQARRRDRDRRPYGA